ncbi:MAG: D-xylose ABC transporter ATP-binding protein [Pedosphaera sp. Tous-C6FEB]|nr:MAG: D-xylose ABC transporter ATP-binding protein [Pedosphaera sp. Tous-C6FEB]
MPYLTFSHLTKRFPGVLALDDVSFTVERGECHALMGENGAGKSTLGKILAGVYRPDGGEIRVEGDAIYPTDPHRARQLGIAMVHQELAFCPNLTIAENLCLGDLPKRFGVVSRVKMREQARAMLKEIECDLDVDVPISRLSTAQEQLVQIAGAVGTGARIIVMDEPTSSLSVAESEHLFKLLRQLKQREITVIYVSHRMEEIFKLCDTITVLRDGKHVATERIIRTNHDRVVHQMVGREVEFKTPHHVALELGAPVLQVEDLTSPGKFKDISFTIRSGEVVGLAGLVGAGRSEIAQAIFGLDPRVTGEVRVCGKPLPLRSVPKMMAAGVGLLPEDRKRQGLVLSMNCRENASLAAVEQMTWPLGIIKRSDERAITHNFLTRLKTRMPNIESPVATLSGGNQQKVALAKWLARDCRMLMVDEPTRGVDIGAKAEIHGILDEFARAKMGMLVISSELPELINLCRRILVVRDGRLVGELERDQFSQTVLLRMMAGVAVPTA